MARPLLNLHWPQLAGFVQPLGGEYAARRSLLERLPFPVGYGVELGMLVDALHLVGLDALAQVDVGVRHHRHQDGQALGRMAADDLPHRAAPAGPRPPGAPAPSPSSSAARQGFEPHTHPVDTEERPPMTEIAEYAARGCVTAARAVVAVARHGERHAGAAVLLLLGADPLARRPRRYLAAAGAPEPVRRGRIRPSWPHVV